MAEEELFISSRSSLLSSHPNVRTHYECCMWFWVKCGPIRSEVECLHHHCLAYVVLRVPLVLRHLPGVKPAQAASVEAPDEAKQNPHRWIQHHRIKTQAIFRNCCIDSQQTNLIIIEI